MESLISETRIAEELAAFKATAGLLATQKLRYSSQYTPPVQDRPRKATLVHVPVCEPPATDHSRDDPAGDDDTSTNDTVDLVIKSLKPPLSFKITAHPTQTILSLKQHLAQTHASKGAPPAQGQRWILKGKSLTDSKLLREYNVSTGSVINLMVTKTTTTTPRPTSGATADDPEEPSTTTVPSLTLSEPSSSSSQTTSTTTPPSIALDKLPPPTTSTSTSASGAAAAVHSSQAYRDRIQDPELWQSIRTMLEEKFAGVENRDAEAQQAWEGMLKGCQEWIEPVNKALIRDRVGYSAMGGY